MGGSHTCYYKNSVTVHGAGDDDDDDDDDDNEDDDDEDDNNDNDDDAARQDGGGVGPDPGHSPLRLPPLLLHDPAQSGH